MKYLRVFKTEAQYKAYCKGNDVWLPRVAYVVTDYKNPNGNSTGGTGTAPSDYDTTLNHNLTWAQYIDSSVSWDASIMSRTTGYVDWRVLHTEFMRVANGGTCYLTDTNKVVAPGTPTEDASAWLEVISYDPSTDTSYCVLHIRSKSESAATACSVTPVVDNDTSMLVADYKEKIHAYNYDFT